MQRLTKTKLQPGRHLFGLLAMAGLLVSSVDAGPKGRKARPSVQADVPQIAADNHSKSFLADRIADDTEIVIGETVAAENYQGYADRLAEVLATFTPAQQRKIIYGE